MPRRSEKQVEPLLIDRAAAAEIPSENVIREWAREKRAFISSVMSELREERKAVAAALREEGVRPVMFEEFGGRDADPVDAYLAEVEGSDIFIGILGQKYGTPLKTRFSATHTEYLHAEKHSLRIAMWTSRSPDREGPEQSFLMEARTFHVVPEYRNIADLQAQVRERVRTIAAEDLSPWCKLGKVVFRASEVVAMSSQWWDVSETTSWLELSKILAATNGIVHSHFVSPSKFLPLFGSKNGEYNDWLVDQNCFDGTLGYKKP